jgi:GAF domain-containing protein
MLAPAKPDDESTRLHTVRSPDAADTVADERFDGLTRLARRHFSVAVTLIVRVEAERQWFASCDGIPFAQTPRDLSFCEQATDSDDLLVVPDILADNCLHDHPHVIHTPCIRFYAGCPLRTSNGETLGAFCLLDTTPRELDDGQRECLRDFARLATAIV